MGLDSTKWILLSKKTNYEIHPLELFALLHQEDLHAA